MKSAPCRLSDISDSTAASAANDAGTEPQAADSPVQEPADSLEQSPRRRSNDASAEGAADNAQYVNAKASSSVSTDTPQPAPGLAESTVDDVKAPTGATAATGPGDNVGGSTPPLPAAAASVLARSRRDQLVAVFGVSAIAVLVAFDSTIVSTSLPRVAEVLNGMALYAWVASGYLLAMAVTIPIFGRMGDLFGRKRLMFWSVILVATCSVACGFAQSMSQLVIMRSLQGIGGGMMVSTAFAAPADLFPEPRERVRWMALLSAIFAAASGIGPVLGGAITETFSWRWAFMVVPAAAIPTAWIIHRYFPDMRPARRASLRQLDLVGGVLLMLAVGTPLIAMELGFAGGGNPVAGLALLAVGLAALALLVPYEKRVAVPMLPLRVLGSTEARLLNISAFMVGAIMFVLIYFGPLLLQNVLGVGPRAAGLLMTPLVMGIPMGSILNGYLFPRQNQPQRLLILGSILLGAGCTGAIALDAGVSPKWAMLVFGCSGIGLGFLLPNLTMFMQIIAERRDVGVASALVQTTRAIGSALGIAAVGVFISRTSVLAGIRWGLISAVVCCVFIGLLAFRVRMRNVQETKPASANADAS